MLKSLINIALSFLLLVSTAGLSITKHYCGNSLEEVSLFSQPEPCCAMEGCCHNETSFHQLKEDFFSPVNDIKINSGQNDLLFTAFFFVKAYEPVQPESHLLPFAKSPPFYDQHTVLSLLQSFLC